MSAPILETQRELANLYVGYQAGTAYRSSAMTTLIAFSGSLRKDSFNTRVLRALRAAIAEADGVIIAGPEYNHSFSAATKNLIDWASRPIMAGPIIGKTSMLIATSPGPGGGVHANAAAAEILQLLNGKIVAQVTAAKVHEKFAADSDTIIDEELATQLREGLAAF
jgi:NAD(P)H-dependent FMN reductase